MRQPKFSKYERNQLSTRLREIETEKSKEISEKLAGLERYPERFDNEINAIKSALSMCNESEEQ